MTQDEIAAMGDEQLAARVCAAEGEAAQLRADLDRSRHQLNKLRGELSESRVRCGQLERQLAGYDDREFDPGEQKGLGAIPVGGPDLSEVEAIEAALGMSPTLDQQLRQLGLGAKEAPRLSSQHDDAMMLDTERLPELLRLLWKCRDVLLAMDLADASTDGASEALRAIERLPMSLFYRYIDIDSWDAASESFPPLAKD